MRRITPSFAITRRKPGALFLALGLLAPTPALAQYIGTAPPPPLPAAPRPGEIESPAASLARAVRILAQSPRNFPALINAGRAALDLGDTQAAIGFFGRAGDVSPSSPAPKIGMGAATVASGDVPSAILDAATTSRADLVVVGTRGHGVVHRALVGSTSRRVLHHAPMSVLIVPSPVPVRQGTGRTAIAAA